MAGLTRCGMVFPIESARKRATMPSVLILRPPSSVALPHLLDVHTEYVYRDWNSANKSGASHKSISNPEQVLPLAKLALETHAFGDLECSR